MDLVLVTEDEHGLPARVVPQEVESRGCKDEGQEDEVVHERRSVPKLLFFFQSTCRAGCE